MQLLVHGNVMDWSWVVSLVVEIVKLLIQKLKVVHVVLCLEELVLWIKQRVRLRQVILVSVRQRRGKGRIRRTIHRGAQCTMTIWSTSQHPPPQHPVPPPNPVSVYLHPNVHKSMEMNQTLQAVSVVRKDVLLLVRIVLNLPIPVHYVLLQLALLQMEWHWILLELIVNAVVRIV